jgi:hypothetical protein
LSIWLLASATLTACGDRAASAASDAFPETLHGMPLVTVHEGETAAEMIGNLHRFGVAPENSRVAVYAVQELQAILYESRFATDSIAGEQLAAMSESIGDGVFGFGHRREMAIADLEVHSVIGHGQEHYFFTRDRRVVWLAAPPLMARMMLAEILEVVPAEVPPSPQIGIPPRGDSPT